MAALRLKTALLALFALLLGSTAAAQSPLQSKRGPRTIVRGGMFQRADSLQQVLERQNLYVMNIQDIFLGKIKADTVRSMDSLAILREDSLMERTQRETDFRKQYEEAEKYNLTNITAHTEADGLIFYRPTRGMISAKFDAERGEGIDIARKYRVEGYPTFLILNAEGKEVGRIVGGDDAAAFIKKVDGVLANIQ